MVNIKISRFSKAKKNEPTLNDNDNNITPIETIEPLSYDNLDDNNILDDLNSLNYKPDVAPIKEPKIKTKDKPFDLTNIINKNKEKITQSSTFSLDSNNLLEKIKNKSNKTKIEKIKNDYDDSIFSQNGSELLGRDKRVLLTKIRQYKSLFPDTFKTFKIKVNANTQELQNYLDEMDSIVECDNVEQFLLDSILQCIKLLEGVSSYTKYDIQGLADLLKQNKQFHQLAKQLFIKYKVFNAIPIESQMLMLVATSAYICNSKNKRRGEIEYTLIHQLIIFQIKKNNF